MSAEIQMREAQLREMMNRLQEDVKVYNGGDSKVVDERIAAVKHLIESCRLEFRYISHEDKNVYREVTRCQMATEWSNSIVDVARAP